uniref:Uncharacterized protein n=1 Tax=Arundo donax TaxID=35708 RepID=A0A0A9EZ56_ARUDO
MSGARPRASPSTRRGTSQTIRMLPDESLVLMGSIL